MDDSDDNHGGRRFHQTLEVFGEASIASQPAEGAFDHPASWDDLEAVFTRRSFDDLQLDQVWLPEGKDLGLYQLYRAMDLSAEYDDPIEEEVFWNIRNVHALNFLDKFAGCNPNFVSSRSLIQAENALDPQFTIERTSKANILSLHPKFPTVRFQKLTKGLRSRLLCSKLHFQRF